MNARQPYPIDASSTALLRQRLQSESPQELLAEAAALRDQGHGEIVSYSPKVFIPLTRLCRDVCHYCTFAKSPARLDKIYLDPDDVLAIARAGEAAGCHEALFTLGDKPELRWREAREWLDAHNYVSTIDYLVAMCALVLNETRLLPHANPGVMTGDELARLRMVSASQGLMLETASPRLSGKGMVHFGSPDKLPAARLETIRLAGELAIPYTSGILIGIGETREERLDALLALKDLHDRYGHLQEIIIQNFRAKDDTKLAGAHEPGLADLQWTIAAARLLFGPDMNIQAPPNLSADDYRELIDAGINDWGGVSPVTADHVNPECPWPELDALRAATHRQGKVLVPRLPVYPRYLHDGRRWLADAVMTQALRASDGQGYGREDRWVVGTPDRPRLPASLDTQCGPASNVASILERAGGGQRLAIREIETLFRARGTDFERVCAAADALRREVAGETVTYVVNRNINYTNVCGYRCQFCAFSKGRMAESLRGDPYDLPVDEVVRRSLEAWDRGATEVCLQGGIHPDYTGETYLTIAREIRTALPGMHIHAFSPLEVTQGASTLGIGVGEFLGALVDAGLATLPGTAAEILCDDVRATLCPDKISSAAWLSVMETAHRLGIRTTATIMFGHMERYEHWARHLLAVRDLQAATGGFTEFVPLPFVAAEAPLFMKGRARRGPTLRETLLMHAVARLALHPLIPNIQASWVKLGPEGVRLALAAGANDLGGTLMNESISRAAGSQHGQEMPPEAMDETIRSLGRSPQQRTTLYGRPPPAQVARSYGAAALAQVQEPRAGKFARTGSSRNQTFLLTQA